MNIYETLAKCRTGICIMCDQQLTEQDTDHSICNQCWDLIGDDNE
jgi:hypothetical protein